MSRNLAVGVIIMATGLSLVALLSTAVLIVCALRGEDIPRGLAVVAGAGITALAVMARDTLKAYLAAKEQERGHRHTM